MSSFLPACRLAAVGLCVVLMTGCMTSRVLPGPEETPQQYEPAALPASLSVTPPQAGKQWPVASLGRADAVKAGLAGHLSTWVPAPSANAPGVFVTIDSVERKANWWSFLGYLATLTLIPAWEDYTLRTTVSVRAGSQELYHAESTDKVRSYLSVYFPTPLFLGRSHNQTMAQVASSAMARQYGPLAAWVEAEHARFDQELAGKGPGARQAWLKANPDSLFRPDILRYLAEHPRGRDRLAWHRQNMALFPDYAAVLPADHAVWFSGPRGMQVVDVRDALRAGEDAGILAARIRAGAAPYRAFSPADLATLRKGGMPSGVVAAMIEVSGHARPAVSAPASVAGAAPRLVAPAALPVIRNNSGQYMCPWTSDGVLADWVDKAINARMGGAAGGALGAYAGAKAMENVPFVGGFLGAKVGEASGRAIAIKAAGGEAYIRQTSDLSFNSLDDMARYVQAHYATSSHYQNAVKAADEIYPGLMKTLVRVSAR